MTSGYRNNNRSNIVIIMAEQNKKCVRCIDIVDNCDRQEFNGMNNVFFFFFIFLRWVFHKHYYYDVRLKYFQEECGSNRFGKSSRATFHSKFNWMHEFVWFEIISRPFWLTKKANKQNQLSLNAVDMLCMCECDCWHSNNVFLFEHGFVFTLVFLIFAEWMSFRDVIHKLT